LTDGLHTRLHWFSIFVLGRNEPELTAGPIPLTRIYATTVGDVEHCRRCCIAASQVKPVFMEE
jgi:hypothetical protein